MKPFLGIDLTEDKSNEKYDGEEFLSEKPSSAMSAALDSQADKALKMINKSKLPIGVRVVQWICGVAGTIITMGILRGIITDENIGFAEAYQNAFWLFWLAGLCLIIWLILTIIGHRREKTVMESDEINLLNLNSDTISKNIYAELHVPQDAQTVDIISFSYKMKNGEPQAATKGFENSAYTNFEYKLFKDSDSIYLADLEGKYRFPLQALRKIQTVNKNIVLPFWNKDEEPNKGIYKKYKLSVDKFGSINFKPYHILELEHNGEIWGIYFPSYELPEFEKVTGLTAE